MYWGERLPGKIRRANLDGSGLEDLVTGLGLPRSIALDEGGGKMYWPDGDSPMKIQRANLDGSNVEDLVTTGIPNPAGIALDVSASKMYWTDLSADKIQRANLDGSGVEVLLTGLSGPVGIALDVGPPTPTPTPTATPTPTPPPAATPTPTPGPAVGGIVEIQVNGSGSAVDSAADSPAGSSAPNHVALAGLAAAALVALGAGAWYARRRWLG